MNPCIVNVAIGSRYHPLSIRLDYECGRVCPDVPLIQWRDELPPGAPDGIGLPWLAYCAKPFAMLEAMRRGHDLLIWCDAACYPIRHPQPLVEHLDRHGHYMQDNGFPVGEWSSDAALIRLGLSRDEAFSVPECSAMCFGLDVRRTECHAWLREWAALAADGVTFLGAHANEAVIDVLKLRGLPYRTVGHVSDDRRVMGHRHDQTAASVLAWRRGWQRTPRPVFADYWREVPDDRTVFVNRG